MEEYEVSFKPMYIEADGIDDAKDKVVEQVRLGNLEIEEVEPVF